MANDVTVSQKEKAFKIIFKICVSEEFEKIKTILRHIKTLPSDLLGNSPLHYVAHDNKIDTARLLLDSRLQYNVQNKSMKTPLHLAAQNGHTEMCKLLLQYGSNVNLKDIMGMTALHWAVTNEHMETVTFLMENGADPYIVDIYGRSAMSIADMNIQILSELTQENKEKEHSTGCKRKHDIIIDSNNNGQKRRRKSNLGDENGLNYLKEHGITYLPSDDSTTIADALKGGRSAVLTEAGYQLLSLFDSYDTPDRDLQRLSRQMLSKVEEKHKSSNETRSDDKLNENRIPSPEQCIDEDIIDLSVDEMDPLDELTLSTCEEFEELNLEDNSEERISICEKTLSNRDPCSYSSCNSAESYAKFNNDSSNEKQLVNIQSLPDKASQYQTNMSQSNDNQKCSNEIIPLGRKVGPEKNRYGTLPLSSYQSKLYFNLLDDLKSFNDPDIIETQSNESDLPGCIQNEAFNDINSAHDQIKLIENPNSQSSNSDQNMNTSYDFNQPEELPSIMSKHDIKILKTINELKDYAAEPIDPTGSYQDVSNGENNKLTQPSLLYAVCNEEPKRKSLTIPMTPNKVLTNDSKDFHKGNATSSYNPDTSYQRRSPNEIASNNVISYNDTTDSTKSTPDGDLSHIIDSIMKDLSLQCEPQKQIDLHPNVEVITLDDDQFESDSPYLNSKTPIVWDNTGDPILNPMPIKNPLSNTGHFDSKSNARQKSVVSSNTENQNIETVKDLPSFIGMLKKDLKSRNTVPKATPGVKKKNDKFGSVIPNPVNHESILNNANGTPIVERNNTIMTSKQSVNNIPVEHMITKPNINRKLPKTSKIISLDSANTSIDNTKCNMNNFDIDNTMVNEIEKYSNKNNIDNMDVVNMIHKFVTNNKELLRNLSEVDSDNHTSSVVLNEITDDSRLKEVVRSPSPNQKYNNAGKFNNRNTYNNEFETNSTNSSLIKYNHSNQYRTEDDSNKNYYQVEKYDPEKLFQKFVQIVSKSRVLLDTKTKNKIYNFMESLKSLQNNDTLQFSNENSAANNELVQYNKPYQNKSIVNSILHEHEGHIQCSPSSSESINSSFSSDISNPPSTSIKSNHPNINSKSVPTLKPTRNNRSKLTTKSLLHNMPKQITNSSVVPPSCENLSFSSHSPVITNPTNSMSNDVPIVPKIQSNCNNMFKRNNASLIRNPGPSLVNLPDTDYKLISVPSINNTPQFVIIPKPVVPPPSSVTPQSKSIPSLNRSNAAQNTSPLTSSRPTKYSTNSTISTNSINRNPMNIPKVLSNNHFPKHANQTVIKNTAIPINNFKKTSTVKMTNPKTMVRQSIIPSNNVINNEINNNNSISLNKSSATYDKELKFNKEELLELIKNKKYKFKPKIINK